MSGHELTVADLPVRRLGADGLRVSAIGLGCMGMSHLYGPADEAESSATIERALELGVFYLDTSSYYGLGENERLIGRVVAGRREEVVISTKFGIVPTPDGPRVSGRPEFVRASCEESLGRLGTEYIDLLFQHRVDPQVPIEETVGAMAGLVAEGKVRRLGLSAASAATLERAAAVHPIAAIQSEWSLWVRDIEQEVLPAARRLGTGIVPYSPLGRGFLAGSFTGEEQLADGDYRRRIPRFSGETLELNRALADGVRAVAAEVAATPAQVALAWLLAQGDDVVPIPGTKRRAYVEENAAAASLELPPAALAALDELSAPGRWPGQHWATGSPREGDSPEPGGTPRAPTGLRS
jgi:aryl-alcohol dehydrogenase-like predicted oxidoreductase